MGILDFCQQPGPFIFKSIGLSPDFKLLGTILQTFNQLLSLQLQFQSCVHGKGWCRYAETMALPYLRATGTQMSPLISIDV